MSELIKGELLASGKTKSVYTTNKAETLIVEFRDDATAFNAKKHAKLEDKGRINNAINTFVMEQLNAAGIPTHFIQQPNPTTMICKRLDMIPLESVLRHTAAGSLCRRLGIEEGEALEPALQEFFLKSDLLGDPLINKAHIRLLGFATEEEILAMEKLTLAVSDVLVPLFNAIDIQLVDFKLEFGRYNGEILLGDEFTPDGCRLWDKRSDEKLDKDRFRHDLGDLLTGYRVVAERLGLTIDATN